MVKLYSRALLFVCSLACFAPVSADAQCYRKGSLLISVSEGSTFANYTTNDISGAKPVLMHSEFICGDRDPLIIEYALTKRLGLGMSAGTDIFKVNASKFYNAEAADNTMKMFTNELTVDVNYHVFVNKRLDLSVFLSTGLFNVNYTNKQSDIDQQYNASGSILRFGTKARYYFWKRLGAFGMVSSYTGTTSPKQVKGNTVGQNYSTSVDGMAIEAGLCFRILR